MTGLVNSMQLDSEVVYEVGYQRISRRSIGHIFLCTAVCHACTESPWATLLTATISTAIFAGGAVGHAGLLTPAKKISFLAFFSVPTKERPKVFGEALDDLRKNPRIQVRMKATHSQIESIETPDMVLSTSCSQGASRLLAKANLPHASFPISISPTLTAFYYIHQQQWDKNIRVKYLNWGGDQSRIEIKIAAIMESILILAVCSIVVDRIYK